METATAVKCGVGVVVGTGVGTGVYFAIPSMDDEEERHVIKDGVNWSDRYMTYYYYHTLTEGQGDRLITGISLEISSDNDEWRRVYDWCNSGKSVDAEKAKWDYWCTRKKISRDLIGEDKELKDVSDLSTMSSTDTGKYVGERLFEGIKTAVETNSDHRKFLEKYGPTSGGNGSEYGYVVSLWCKMQSFLFVDKQESDVAHQAFMGNCLRDRVAKA